MIKKNKKIIEEVNTLLVQISKVLNADRSTFYLLNKDTETLESLVAQGVENIIISVPIGSGIVGSMFKSECPIIENNIQESSLFNNSYDEQLQFRTNSTVCVPVFNEAGIAIGALQCINKKEGVFKEKDITILNSFAAAITFIVKNNELYFATEHIKNNFSTLLDVFTAVSSELDLNNLIQLIMNKAAEITNSERSSLFLVDDETGELWTVFAKGLGNKTVRTKKGIVAQVAKSKKALIVNDPYKHFFFDSSIDKKTNFTTKSILSVPVFNADNKVLGVIQTINKVGENFTIDDLNILTGFASQIRIAIENAKLFDQIQGMKNHLNILVQNLDNGIVTIDKSLKIRTTNDTFFKMFGLKPADDLINTHIEDVNNFIKPLFMYCEETIRSGEKIYQDDLEIKINAKKAVTVNLSVLPMQDAKGKVIGAITVFNDISKEKRIQSNLSRYIPQHLVKEVMNKDNLSLLKGSYSKCSILFSDIRNFTTLTEEFGAIQIVELLNKYFEAMISSVHKYDGILDKYIGDAIMTVFGVPYANISDAKNAVSCALDMFTMLSKLNKKNTKLPLLNIGIGISTGNVVSGNIGSEKRFEYTVIGDSVNLAARLETATKTYNVNILICEETYNEVKNDFHCREIDTLLVKGKNIPVKVFTVISDKKEPLTKVQLDFNLKYSKGLSHYKKDEYQKAIQYFREAKELKPKDGATQVFIERLNTFILERV
ncbi:adenylate/guanylate cyclase domain-containing protein [Polaribacter sp. Q13]|uniref:adenylate/guanylate cyclase domain-containing protein n=1 Tax=Polaribacter sp. Q13 TaxID=2806551 RepID=UPI00193B3B4B|nr:adenylate/guanylate cyclase domain-containing protein [Polaribacter sp. Q13]QVY64631.1 GAF domain-containing protein [Polaribacter sp. Q13]